MDDNEKILKLAGVFMVCGHAFAFSDIIGISRNKVQVPSEIRSNDKPTMVAKEQVVVILNGGIHVAITTSDESVDEIIARWIGYRTYALDTAQAIHAKAAAAEAEAEAEGEVN